MGGDDWTDGEYWMNRRDDVWTGWMFGQDE